jgi:hypothetical protein
LRATFESRGHQRPPIRTIPFKITKSLLIMSLSYVVKIRMYTLFSNYFSAAPEPSEDLPGQPPKKLVLDSVNDRPQTPLLDRTIYRVQVAEKAAEAVGAAGQGVEAATRHGRTPFFQGR